MRGTSDFVSDISSFVDATSIESNVLECLIKEALFLMELFEGTVISAETGFDASQLTVVKLGSTEIDAFLGAVVMLGRQCSVFLEN